jgi:2-keto-3-deoxy-L-arabinonate dehydratase
MIRGILPIVHTPFLDDATMDEESLAREVQWAVQQGADGFCTGMVSELLRLTYDERIRLTRLLSEQKPAGKVFIAGVGAESTQQAVTYAREAEQAGADGVMAIPPVSTGLPDAQVLEYFSTLAEQISLPIVVQDASAYVGRPIAMSVYLQLLDTYGPERILFKPEASPVGPNVSALRDATGGRARIFDGSGGIALVDCYRRGIAGTMPGMEFLPGIVALWKALEQGDDETVYRIYFPICALVTLQLQAGLDGFLATEKYLLHRQGLFTTPHRRKPYAWDLDPETQAELDRLVARLEESLRPLD